MTGSPQDQEIFQRSLQTFVDELQPWLSRRMARPIREWSFPSYGDFSFDATREEVSMVIARS